MAKRRPVWRDRPPEQQFLVKRLLVGSDAWVDCHMKELRRGDIFRCYSPVCGHQIDPMSGQHCPPRLVSVCMVDAMRNLEDGIGYWVPDIAVGLYPQVLRELAH